MEITRGDGARLAGYGGELWLPGSHGSRLLIVPVTWSVDRTPLRVRDETGAIRLRAGDTVAVPPGHGPVAAETLIVLSEAHQRVLDVRVPTLDSDGRGPALRNDLLRAARVWRLSPALPLIGALIALVNYVPDAVRPRPIGCGVGFATDPCHGGVPILYAFANLLSIPVLIFGLGFYGVERRWYAEVFDGHKPKLGWMIAEISRYVPRYFRLGLVLLLVYAPIDLYIGLQDGGADAATLVVSLVILLAVDVLLTFVTPALAFTTHRVSEAISIGVRLLGSSWPRDLPYVIATPFAATLLLRVAKPSSAALTIGLGVAAQLLTMLCAGATTLFFLRVTRVAGEK